MNRRAAAFLQRHGIRGGSLRWLWRLSAPFKWGIATLMLARSLLSALGVAMALVNKYVIDLASAALDMRWSILLAAAGTAVSLAGSLMLSAFSVRLTERYSCHVRQGVYARILASQWSARVGYHSEELLSRLTSDVNAVTNGLVGVLSALLSTAVQFVLAFFVLWRYDWTVALLAAAIGPLAVLFSYVVSRRLKRLQTALQQSEADYRVFLQEQLAHADVVKAFEGEGRSLDSLDRLQQERLRLVVRRNRWSILLKGGVSVLFSGGYLAAFVTGALKIAAGTMTYGTMTAFLSLVNQVQTPVYSGSRILAQMVGVLASASRVMELASLPAEPVEPVTSNGTALGLRLDGLTAGYDREPVLDGLTAEIAPGSFAVLMGPSGIGKTTLIRVLLGFLIPTAGSAALVEASGREIPCAAGSRRCISYVPQGNTLFSGTIAENLRLGAPEATDAQLRAALEQACAWDFVQRLPQGLKTPVGERAQGISEGQAQRIAIARGLLRPASLLILDEATSALDEDTERRILSGLRARGGQTMLVISHRPAARELADQVIELHPAGKALAMQRGI